MYSTEMVVDSQDLGVGLLTLKDGKPPETRIKCAASAHEIYEKLAVADELRSSQRARVKGMADGNPPYNPQTLKSLGQGHRTNLSFREAEGIRDAAQTPYYDLLVEVPTYATIKTKLGNDDEQAVWSRIISEVFHRTLNNWDGFDYNMQLHQKEMLSFGVGPIFWEDGLDWRFKAVHVGQVKVPDQTQSNLSNLEVITINKEYKAHELYNFIRDEKSAEEIGWDVDAVKDALVHAMDTDAHRDHHRQWEHCQNLIKNNDLYYGEASSATVKTVHLLVKEFNETVSHYIILEEGSEQGCFLYKRLSRYKNFSQCLCVFFYDIGDGTWHSVKGLLTKIFPFIQMKDRLKCQIVDGAFLGSSILVQQADANALQKTQLMTVGPLSILPPGYNLQQNALGSLIDGPLAVERSLDYTLSNNTGTYRQRQELDNQQARTATEINANMMTQAVLNKGAVNRYYTQLDKLYAEVYRRMSNPNLDMNDPGGREAEEFKRECVSMGVPEKALYHTQSVKATRNAGQGSAGQRQQIIAQLMGISGMLPESGRDALIQFYISNLVGQTGVEEFYPKREKRMLPTEDDSEAALENAAMKLNAPVLWNPMQNSARHAQSHIGAGAGAIQSIQQGGNPQEVLQYIMSLAPHIQVHMEQLQKDPTRNAQYKALDEQFKQLGQVAGQLQTQLQQQAEAQQAQMAEQQMAMQQAGAIQQGVDPQMQIKAAEVQANMQLKAQKQQGNQLLKAQNQQFNQSLKDASTAAGINRQNRAKTK